MIPLQAKKSNSKRLKVVGLSWNSCGNLRNYFVILQKRTFFQIISRNARQEAYVTAQITPKITPRSLRLLGDPEKIIRLICGRMIIYCVQARKCRACPRSDGIAGVPFFIFFFCSRLPFGRSNRWGRSPLRGRS